MSINLSALYEQITSSDPDAARRAVHEIGSRLDDIDPASIPELVEVMASLFYIDLGDKPEYVEVVEDAVSVIARIGTPAVKTLMKLLVETDLKATLMVGRTLGRIGPAAYGPLKDLFYRAATPHQRVLALFALAKMHEAALMEIFPDLVTALDDSDSEVRDTAARTIGRVISAFKPNQLPQDQASQAFERLLFRLSDSSAVVRSKVVRSIGKLARNGYLDEEQRQLAREAVESLLGLDGGKPDDFYIVRREAQEALGYLR